MTCDRIQPLLSSYHDDALSFEERAHIRAHVATCSTCHAVLMAYDQLYATLREATVTAPSDLRRNVYTRIAEMEARRQPLLPFGPSLLGALRSAGGTAGLLAVLGALVFAATHLNLAPSGAMQPTAMDMVRAGAALERVFGAIQQGQAATMPVPEQTMVAPLGQRVAPRIAFSVKSSRKSSGGIAVSGLLVRADPRTGAPHDQAVVQAQFAPSGGAHAPSLKRLTVGTWAPFPTIAAEDGLVYLHLNDDNIWQPKPHNSTGQVEWHSFAPGAQPRVLATPGPEQLFTGVTTSLDGRTAYYSALGLGRWGGIFSLPLTASGAQPKQVFSLPDIDGPNRGYHHRYAKQIYPGPSGRVVFSEILTSPRSYAVSVAITTSMGQQVIAPARDPWYNYVVSPDLRYMALTQYPIYNVATWTFGTLQAASRTAPVTYTIGVGAHPLWSPDGRSLLYLGIRPMGLYLWTLADHTSRRVLTLDSTGKFFISGFTWAPGGRYFAYVLTRIGPGGTSQVRLGDTQTGYTWPVFSRQYVGALAWAHGPSPALPARFDSTATPQETIRSYYNALSRHEYARAFGYIAVHDGRGFASFMKGYEDTQAVTVTQLTRVRYMNAANGTAATCIGFAILAHNKTGQVQQYGGWYLLEGKGHNPRFTGWRIVMPGSRGYKDKPAIVPPQNTCTAPAATKAAAQ